jgi:glycosyltransferase involved in cell wall biosynthesis
MRVGVDCLGIVPTYVGGVNTYTFGLLRGLARVATGWTFRLYVTQSNCGVFDAFDKYSNVEIKEVHEGITYRQILWRASSLTGSRSFHRSVSNRVFSHLATTMDRECDAIYAPRGLLWSYNHRKPTLTSMHDIQHVHYPQFFDLPRRISRGVVYEMSAKYATLLQASSDFIKQDFLKNFPGLRPEQIVVIPEGVEIAEFSARKSRSILNKYDLPEEFLFFPAQLWPHKNHITVLKALKGIERSSSLKVPLVLSGTNFSGADVFRFIADQSMSYVRHLGKVPFEDLVALYQAATLVIAPGLYESSSLPVLEAAAAGTAIIASKIPPNEEFSQTLQLNLFDPHDDSELAQTILRLWNDKSLRNRQAATNRNHVECYSWDHAARKYTTIISKLAEFPT